MMKRPRPFPTLLATLLSTSAAFPTAAQEKHANHGHHHVTRSQSENEVRSGGSASAAREADHGGHGPAHLNSSAAEQGTPAEHDAHRPRTKISRTPIPPLTDEDRSSVFLGERGHTVHDRAIISFWLLDQLEWQETDEDNALSWEASGWVGNDIDRLWFRTEGERSGGKTEEAELQVLWGHAIGPWWELVVGVRHDFAPGSAQTWAAVGMQGTPLYDVETEATLYVGDGGQTSVRLAAEYDILLTNRLILQPTAEINLFGKNDPQRGVGTGLADAEIGLRLRYEVRREIAPYIGVSWTRLYGSTADHARQDGTDVEDTRFVIGIRAWY